MEVQGIGGMQIEQMRELMQGMRREVDGIVQSAAGETGLSVQISGMGRGLGELEELSRTDPDKFKELMETIADRLADAAGESDGMKAQFLTDLSDGFRRAGETGDLAELRPPRPPMAYGEDGKPVDGSLPAPEDERELLEYLLDTATKT